MEKITFERFPELKIETFTKECKSVPSGEEIKDVFVGAKKHEPHIIFTNDELPLFFYSKKKQIYGCLRLDKENTLKEFLFKKLHEIIVQYNLTVDDLYVYFGPSLTFSHVSVERSTLLKVMDMGYEAAAKRTSGIDFFDIPIMNFLMLRKLGIPSENITLNSYDTYECDKLLYSSLRGDGKKNPTIIELE